MVVLNSMLGIRVLRMLHLAKIFRTLKVNYQEGFTLSQRHFCIFPIRLQLMYVLILYFFLSLGLPIGKINLSILYISLSVCLFTGDIPVYPPYFPFYLSTGNEHYSLPSIFLRLSICRWYTCLPSIFSVRLQVMCLSILYISLYVCLFTGDIPVYPPYFPFYLSKGNEHYSLPSIFLHLSICRWYTYLPSIFLCPSAGDVSVYPLYFPVCLSITGDIPVYPLYYPVCLPVCLSAGAIPVQPPDFLVSVCRWFLYLPPYFPAVCL